MSITDADRLRSIKTFPSLVRYLRDKLDWPIASEDFDDLTFDYEPEELGLDAKSAVKIKEIKQLRPLTSGQPWGIFFVNFEPKRLPVVVLRRILRSLVIKKRQSANKSQQAAWQRHDLLFISAYGEADHRDITLANFFEDEDNGDLPTLRVLGWDDEDTVLHLAHAHDVLREKLHWPKDPADVAGWRQTWSAAFTLKHRQVITTSRDLAVGMADLAAAIRKRVNRVLAVESENGPLRRFMNAFREALIHDLSGDDFADMYAQTITYGLLSARVSRPMGLVAENLKDMVPVTNPFLRDLLSQFLTVGGRKGRIDFDELGINEVVQALRDADMGAVLRDFGDRNPQEDPVVHFYELFLKEYDPKKRMKRGVFYTPRPVVSFIVRSVHELLQTEFGLEDGLASTATWGAMAAKHPGLTIPTGTKPSDPFVVILDPAVGTATFLVEVIEIIHRSLTAKWNKEGVNNQQQRAAWNDYVPKHLLPRLHGYELMMAPYAIAHMKIGLKLYETGYRFGTTERARIYLTNTLEPPSDDKKQRVFEEWAPALAHEAKAVNAVKSHQRFTVVIGNPPYAGISSNMTEHAQQIVDAYKIVDGQALNERKLWLQDDYVKFIRTAQTTLEQAGTGILGYITNHGYLDNPTFRGMRQSLMNTFPRVRVLDLHGNANKKEQSPDGSQDKNVFDIRQGVAIGIFSNPSGKLTGPLGRVARADLWGLQDQKSRWLAVNSTTTTSWEDLRLGSPFYLFARQAQENRDDYELGWKITDAMPVTSAGFITARDHFVIDLDCNTLAQRMADFADPRLSDAEIRQRYFAGRGSDKYPDGDTRGWRLGDARKKVQKDSLADTRIRKCLYRPFDERFVYWATWMIDWPRPEVMGQMIAGDNLALITSRMTKGELFAHAQVTRNMSEVICMSPKTSNNGFVFPLWIRDQALQLDFCWSGKGKSPQTTTRRPNFSPRFLQAIAETLHLPQTNEHRLPQGVTAEEIFHYAYSVLHSPAYRQRHAEFLKIDFPRLPLTGNLDLFRALAHFGGELVALHLLESSKLDKPVTTYTGPASPEVERISYARDTVWLDKAQTRGFQGVPERVWSFQIGGYQVCEKWLRDRKGRTLSKDDVEHYHRIVVALSETMRLMGEIDEVIDQHGGWPLKGSV